MNRRDAMLERLPPIYRITAGSLLYQLLAMMANHEAAFDEDMDRVQRSHWVDTALDRQDLAKLGALFEIPIMPWEPDGLYRTRLKATIAARFRGAVTRDVLEFVLVQILNGVLESLGVAYLDLSVNRKFHTGPSDDPREPAFIEFPIAVRRSDDLVGRHGLLRSLDKFDVNNKGLDPVPLQIVIRGVAGGACMTPVVVNLANGSVLAYAGNILCGQELRVFTDERNRISATLNDRDVSARIYTGSGFVAGGPFSPVVPDATPQPLTLDRGVNRIWFFPLALYDLPSLGSAVFGMPAVEVEHGRFGGKSETPFGGTFFDNSLFEQQPAAVLDVWWNEEQPASFLFEIPGGVVLRQPGNSQDPDEDRVRLFALLQQTISLMRAAGVNGRVEPRPLRDSQRQRDLGRVLQPLVDETRMEDRISALSALFDASANDGSRFG